MNEVKSIKRLGKRIYATIYDCFYKSTFTLKLLDINGLMSDENIEKAVNWHIFISSNNLNNNKKQFRSNGLTNLDILENIDNYLKLQKISGVIMLGQDTRERYVFNLTELGKKSFIGYAHYSIGWADELFSFIRTSKEELIETINNQTEFLLDSKENYGSDIKIFSKKDCGTIFSIDPLSEFIKYKELNGTEVQLLVELGMIIPVGPWKAYENIFKPLLVKELN